MIHYNESIQNTRGDALIGYFVKLASTSDNSTVSLYADASLTPIVSVSGVDDACLVDSDGMASFWTVDGTYHMDIYATDATTLVRRETYVQFGVPAADYGDVTVGPAAAWTVDAVSGTSPTSIGLALLGAATQAAARTAIGAGSGGGDLVSTNNLSDVASASTSRTNLGLGTAAVKNTGTSGNTVPLLDGANTYSAKQTFSGGAEVTPASPPATAAVGYLGCPQNIQDATYTTVMSDAGKHLYHTSASAHTWTIDSNANVAYPVGTILTFINASTGGNVTLAITSDNLRWGSSTGSRTLAANGVATAIKVTSTTWRLTGDGLS